MKSVAHLAATAAAICALAACSASAQAFTGATLAVEFASEEFGSLEGTATTVVAGWDFAVTPEWQWGLGLRRTFADVEERRTEPLGANVQDIIASIDDRRGASLRIGRTLGARWLAYAEVGYERYDYSGLRVLRAPVCAPPTSCVISRLDQAFDDSMVSFGVGMEWAMTDSARLRAALGRGDSDTFDRQFASISLAWNF